MSKVRSQRNGTKPDSDYLGWQAGDPTPRHNPLPKSSKRRKEVFPTDEIPHIWFHQTNKDQYGVNGARNSQGNLFCTGTILYSYRDSYPIARIFDSPESRIVLIQEDRYSVTTAKHISMARFAVPSGVPMIEVPHVTPERMASEGFTKDEHRENIAFMLKQANEHIAKFAHARLSWSIESNQRDAIRMLKNIKTYCMFFDIRCPKLPSEPVLTDEARQELRQKDAERKRKAQEKAKRDRALKQRESAEQLQQWLAGESVSFPFAYRDEFARLRIVDNHNTVNPWWEVETSQGARVPLSHAKRALRFVRSIVAAGHEWKRNGHTFHIGNYAIDLIESNGTLHAGCHVISYAEIERIAPQIEALNVAEVSPIEQEEN